MTSTLYFSEYRHKLFCLKNLVWLYPGYSWILDFFQHKIQSIINQMEYMLFSSDILDQFVKRDLFFTESERGRNLFVSDLFPLETSFRSKGNHNWFGQN